MNFVVDASRLLLNDGCSLDPKLAPTKEVLSFRAYSARRRMNRLRRASCKLFQSDLFVKIYHKLEIEITAGRIAVRCDRKIRADLGTSGVVFNLVCVYNFSN